ncbi:hypothetical protein SAMN04488542_102196 [Fontibacillus panacisegetis]|uniref:Uncharacterized protein n=1 Tax=Fontibacillus panacisegetis TaxID=670482 RepID=A0A1G7FXV6_9BACL|nr:hypothetical protein [Fontibacillus panacisegetis]SDE80642.1 hypothetical protein SAMN04488542_102196 [Fontibacillus panacisegetis]
MAKSIKRGVGYVVLLVVGVTLGMQLAETGIGTVYGPAWNQSNTVIENDANHLPGGTYNTPIGGKNTGIQQATQPNPTPAELLLPAPVEPAVDRFADKTAHLLQEASRKGIHWFASLFGPSTPSAE